MKTKEKTVTAPAPEEPASCLPLHVTEVALNLHERAEGIENRPVFQLDVEQPPRDPGGSRLPRVKRLGRYLKLAAGRVRLDAEAARRYNEALAAPAADETAVFLRTELGSARVDLILASRRDGRWSALHRWSDTWRRLGVSRLEIIA
jgi:hypothetical protein